MIIIFRMNAHHRQTQSTIEASRSSPAQSRQSNIGFFGSEENGKS